MKVSVIIPTYNCGKFIEKCLDSLLRQEEFLDFEIIIVDNHSTDDTLKKITEFQLLSLMKI